MNVTLTQLRSFIAVSRERSFTRAAERLSSSQPSVSSAIKQLEAALNLKLFDRTTKELHLTAEGRSFLPIIERLIDDLDEALQDLRSTVERKRGRAAIAVLPSVAANILPSTIAAFSTAHPNIRISLHDANTTGVWRLVGNGEVDLGVAGYIKDAEGLQFEGLIRDPFGAVMRSDHPLSSKTGPVTWSELADFPFISLGQDTGIRPLLDKVSWTPQNIAAPQIEVSNIATILALLRAGLGITALPEMAIRSERVDLVFRTLVDPPLFREIGLVTRTGRSLSPAAASFIEHLRSTLKPQWQQ